MDRSINSPEEKTAEEKTAALLDLAKNIGRRCQPKNSIQIQKSRHPPLAAQPVILKTYVVPASSRLVPSTDAVFPIVFTAAPRFRNHGVGLSNLLEPFFSPLFVHGGPVTWLLALYLVRVVAQREAVIRFLYL